MKLLPVVSVTWHLHICMQMLWMKRSTDQHFQAPWGREELNWRHPQLLCSKCNGASTQGLCFSHCCWALKQQGYKAGPFLQEAGLLWQVTGSRTLHWPCQNLLILWCSLRLFLPKISSIPLSQAESITTKSSPSLQFLLHFPSTYLFGIYPCLGVCFLENLSQHSHPLGCPESLQEEDAQHGDTQDGENEESSDRGEDTPQGRKCGLPPRSRTYSYPT